MARPEEQIQLNATLVELRSSLIAKARQLTSRMRQPRPEPDELVSETVNRLLAKYTDDEIKSIGGLAFVTLTRLVIDIARKRKRWDGGFIEDESAIPDDSIPVLDPIAQRRVQRALAKLDVRERCVLTRIAIEEHAVVKAFGLCGWETPSHHAEYNKVLVKFRKHLEDAT